MTQVDPNAQLQQRLARLEAREAARQTRTRRILRGSALALVVLIPMATFALPTRNVFDSGSLISAGDVNTNFENLWNQVEANATAVGELEAGHDVLLSGQHTVSVAVESDSTTPVQGEGGWLQVTITTTGRPVFVGLATADGSTASNLYTHAETHYNSNGYIVMTRHPESGGSTQVFSHRMGVRAGQGVGNDVDLVRMYIPPSSVWHIDTPLAAGTYTYKLQAKSTLGDDITFNNVRLVAYEL